MTIVIMITTKSEWVWMDVWGSEARWVAGEKGGGARFWLHQHEQVGSHFPFSFTMVIMTVIMMVTYLIFVTGTTGSACVKKICLV